MLLEKNVSSYNDNENRENLVSNTMGLLDTSLRSSGTSSRLITAMLADRSFQPNSTTSSSLYNSYPQSSFSGTYNNNNSNMDGINGQYKPSMYMTNVSQTQPSDNRAPKGTMVPTCVVSPSPNDVDYRSYDEESQQSYPPGYIPSRKRREFIPENKKDDGYWEKRRKNNEAARRSREKRRYHDMALENRIMELTRENCKLKNELQVIKKKYGISLDETFTGEEMDQSAGHQRDVPSLLNQVSETLRSGRHSPQSNTSPEQLSRYSSTMQQSPVRSRNVSGAPQSSYVQTTYPSSHSVASHQQSSSNQIIAESYYLNRPHATVDPKYSGKTDQQSHLNRKSVKHEQRTSVMRVDDEVRPEYSSALPPNQITPYSSSFPLACQKSYWIPTTDLTSSDSNDDECDWNDQVQEQPLSLVKKRPSTENESSGEMSNGSSRASNSPPSSSLPLKLRHKVNSEGTVSLAGQFSTYPNGLAQLSELVLSHSNMPLSSIDKYRLDTDYESENGRSRSFTLPRSMYDAKYVERRKRNNEAARKCRENRKQLTKIREVKSGYLESENGKLKDELLGLQEEMKELRELLDKKRKDKGQDDDIGTEADNEDCGDAGKVKETTRNGNMYYNDQDSTNAEEDHVKMEEN
ncbi:Nfil3p [Mactra antiquata]